MSIDPLTRFEIISSAIESGSAIAIITRETIIWGQEHGKFGDEEPNPAEDRTLLNLKDRIKDREFYSHLPDSISFKLLIRSAAASGESL